MFADVPSHPLLPIADDADDHLTDDADEEDHDTDMLNEARRYRRAAEPRVSDPYASEDSSSMLVPVAVAIGIFIPLVFCLCKL